MRNRPIDRLGVPVQQSMIVNPEDYSSFRVDRSMLGVVLSVNQADSVANRSAYQRADYRGYFHTCTVLVVQDGRDTFVPFENVVIPPTHVSGLDSYYERLPRGCSSLVTGEAFNAQLSQLNVYDLDGDWVVVSFLGGSLDLPYISNYWAHPRNPHDPATSGRRNPVTPSEGSTLAQPNRYFQRINGVEYVVTGKGDIYLSTYRANSSLRFGNDISPVAGRFPRTLDEDTGGSVKLWVKPSQCLELDFNAPVDGIGIEDIQDDSLPQTNPGGRNTSSGGKDNTYVKLTKERGYLTVSDEIKLHSKKRILLTSEEETTLTVGTNLTLDVSGDTSVSTDGGLTVDVTQDLGVTVTGRTTLTARTTLDVQATGQATINSMATLTLSSTGVLSLAGSSVSIGAGGASGGPGSVSVTPAGVDLGTGTLGGVVGGIPLQVAVAAFATAVTTAQSLATIETAYSAAITAAAAALVVAIGSAASSTTRVG